jgi:hypothetical protein
MSGVPLKADIRLMRLNVRKVPIAAVRLSDYAAGVGEQDRGDGNGHFSARLWLLGRPHAARALLQCASAAAAVQTARAVRALAAALALPLSGQERALSRRLAWGAPVWRRALQQALQPRWRKTPSCVPAS